MNNKLVFIILLIPFILFSSCKNKYSGIPEKYHNLLDQALLKAGSNSVELEKALKQSAKNEKEGMAFLISYMPQTDLDSITASLLLENCHYAYQAKAAFSWAKNIPDSIFLNDVLPFFNLNERRDDWRGDFYNRFSKYVKDCKTITCAIDSVNAHIRDEVLVDYNTEREKPNQSPYESMRQGMASCTGLSILLADAFRSVGIPARIAGCPLWYDNSGNHNWVEVWIDGKWHFTEYYPSGLDSGWVVEKAGRCDPNIRERAIYAASFKPTNLMFPLVWDTAINWIYATNESNRYIELYQKEKMNKTLKENETIVKIALVKEPSETIESSNRVAGKITIYLENAIVESGFTSGATQDMNDILYFILEKNKTYTAVYNNEMGEEKRTVFLPEKIDAILILH